MPNASNYLATETVPNGLLKRLSAFALPDNEGAVRFLNKLGFPCDIPRSPARRMMHITVHLTGAAPTEDSQTVKET